MRGILHTSIVTEAEQIADGWKVHDGSGCPVPLDSRPAIMFRDGCIRSGFQAGFLATTSQDWWKHEGPRPECNIIAYREEPKP